jgi:CHAD domain-containing protein
MKIKKFIRKRFKKISKHLRDFSISNSSQSLHQFRVEIKKLKALHLYINFIDPKQDPDKMMNPHKKIFRVSGELRDGDMLNNLANRYGVTLYTTTKTHQRSEQIKMMTALLPAYLNSLHMERDRLYKITKNISKKRLGKFLKRQETKVKKILSKDNIEKKLHTARKISKNIIYLSMLDKKFSAVKMSLYGKLQKLLGEWHDKLVMMEKFKKSASRKLPTIYEKLKKGKERDVDTIRIFSRRFQQTQ